MLTRRKLLGSAIGTAAISTFMVNRGSYALSASAGRHYSARAIELVRQATVIDMLGVLSINPTDGQQWLVGEGLPDHKLREFIDSGINVFHVARGMAGAESYTQALEYFARYNGFVARYPQHFTRISTLHDLESINASGKVGLLLGIQNADHFRKVDDVDLFFGLGQRCAQLTYNSQNLIGSGSTDRVDGGISDFGASIIERMNSVGMLIDVSHCGDKTTLDAFDISSKPVAITHSNCRALNNHPRLKTDQAIKKMAATGGVMGITGVRMFVRDREPTTIEHMVDHIDHVARLVGVEHVGIGSDADLIGYDDQPADFQEALRASYKNSYGFREQVDIQGFDHPLKMFDLTDVLIKRGYSDTDIGLILGGNFKRMLGDVWPRKNL